MPHVVRLPAHVSEDEVRVCWDTVDQASDVSVWGPKSVGVLALSHFCGKQQVVSASMPDMFHLRMSGIVSDGPSFMEQMAEQGYDPQTVVFSIRKKGSSPPEQLPVDVRKLVEDAQEASTALEKILHDMESLKGFYVLDQEGHEELSDRISAIQQSLAGALDLMDGRVKHGG